MGKSYRPNPLSREKAVLRRRVFLLSLSPKLFLAHHRPKAVDRRKHFADVQRSRQDSDAQRVQRQDGHRILLLLRKEIAHERRKQDEQKRMIREHFQGQGWRTRELLDEMNRCNDFYFDKLCQIRMQSWTKGRVALIGDAGYCPSPAAGMGGSVAILGAAVLADALEKYPDDLRTAFQKYDDSFRPLIEGIQAQAVAFGLEMFMPSSEKAIQRRNLQLGIS